MARRFVELAGIAPGERRFGFWDDTHSGHLFRIMDRETWKDWGSFVADLQSDWLPDHRRIDPEEYRPLCPPWVFGDHSPPEDLPGLARMLGDEAEQNGVPEGGRLGMEAAAEIERMAREHAELKAAWEAALDRIEADRAPTRSMSDEPGVLAMAEERDELLRVVRIVAQRTPSILEDLRYSRGCAVCGADGSDEHRTTCAIGAILARIDGR